jgi:hypothetical protein
MIAMPQATAALYIRKFTKYLVNFDRYLLIFSKKYTKFNFLTVCEIFFKLKFSKYNQIIRTLESFGKFLLIVSLNHHNPLSFRTN